MAFLGNIFGPATRATMLAGALAFFPSIAAAQKGESVQIAQAERVNGMVAANRPALNMDFTNSAPIVSTLPEPPKLAEFEHLQFDTTNTPDDFDLFIGSHALQRRNETKSYQDHIIVVNFLSKDNKYSAYQQSIVEDTLQALRKESHRPILMVDITIDGPEGSVYEATASKKNLALYEQYMRFTSSKAGDLLPYTEVGMAAQRKYGFSVTRGATSKDVVKQKGQILSDNIVRVVRELNGSGPVSSNHDLPELSIKR